MFISLLLFAIAFVLFHIYLFLWLGLSEENDKRIFFLKYELIFRLFLGIFIVCIGPYLEETAKHIDLYLLKAIGFGVMCFLKAALTILLWKSITDWMKAKGDEKQLQHINTVK